MSATPIYIADDKANIRTLLQSFLEESFSRLPAPVWREHNEAIHYVNVYAD
jgi:hypothetical protein